MDVTCDGHSVYGKPFEPRFGNDQYLRSFLSVYQALARQNQVQNCNIDYEDYKGGYCFWGYDLTPDQAANQSHFTVSIHCAPEMSEIDCIGRIESFWPKFVRGW